MWVVKVVDQGNNSSRFSRLLRQLVRASLLLVFSMTGLGSPAHADSPLSLNSARDWATSFKRDWLKPVWHLPLFESRTEPRKLVDDDEDGFRLTRPFGEHGPELRLSTSMPSDTEHCLHTAAGFDSSAVSGDMVEGFVILQHRW